MKQPTKQQLRDQIEQLWARINELEIKLYGSPTTRLSNAMHEAFTQPDMVWNRENPLVAAWKINAPSSTEPNK